MGVGLRGEWLIRLLLLHGGVVLGKSMCRLLLLVLGHAGSCIG